MKAVPGFGRLGAKAGVVLRDINVSKPSIGRLDAGQAMGAQQGRQTVLQSVPEPFDPPASLRAVRRYMLDFQVAQSPANLGQSLLVDLAACLGRVKIMAAAVAIERRKQAMALNGLG